MMGHSDEHRQMNFFLLAGLLSVRCAPVSERSKACIEAKAKQAKNQTTPTKNTTKTQKKTPQPETPKPPEAFAASETGETAFTRNR